MRATGGAWALISDFARMLLGKRIADSAVTHELVGMMTGVGARAMVVLMLTVRATVWSVIAHWIAESRSCPRRALERHRDDEKAEHQQFEVTAHRDQSLDLLQKT